MGSKTMIGDWKEADQLQKPIKYLGVRTDNEKL